MAKIKVNWILIAIMLIGAFFRLYKIGEYMTFLGDEGRDVIVVRNLLVKFDPILIGPGTSAGNMYLGPLYYYFMAPFLFLANYSPTGPAVGIALLGIATIYLVYISGKGWFNKRVGLISSGLFAIAPTVIVYSRSSWNPNIMPFFALLSIYSIWSVWAKKQYAWLIVCAVSFAFVLQSHYLGLLLFLVLFLFWLLSKPKTYIPYTIYSILIFLFLMSPLVIFDIRHDFLNLKAFYNFVIVEQGTGGSNIVTQLSKLVSVFVQINTSLITANNEFLGKLISLGLVVLAVFGYKRKKKIFLEKFFLLFAWIILGIFGLTFYKGNVYDHYFGFLFPAVIVFFVAIADFSLVHLNKFGKFFIYFILLIIFILNLVNNPLRFYPNKQMQRAKNVTEKAITVSNDKPFNFAVLAERNYEDGYQYFLEKENANFVEIDAQIPASVTDQLIVICEMPKEKCDPTHSAKAEVANFGWSKIEDQWEIDGVIIYKLIHSK